MYSSGVRLTVVEKYGVDYNTAVMLKVLVVFVVPVPSPLLKDGIE